MHRLTYVAALFLAIALALQSTAQTVCEAICLGVTASGSTAPTVKPQPALDCHSFQQTNSTRSASLVARDGECQHADVARSFGAERVPIRAESSATTFPLSIGAALQTRPRSAVTDVSHAPPDNDLPAIAPLRL